VMPSKRRTGDPRYVLTLRPPEFAVWSEAFLTACAHVAGGDFASAHRRLLEFDGRAVAGWFHFTAQNSGHDRITLLRLCSKESLETKTAPKTTRTRQRMPTEPTEHAVYTRDKFRCRYCRTPVVPKSVIEYISDKSGIDLRKKSTNLTTHGAYWLHAATIDHIVPHADGGTNDEDNLATACPACQFGKGSFSLAQLRLTLRPPATDLRVADWSWTQVVLSIQNNRP